jgi:hypothetical protein
MAANTNPIFSQAGLIGKTSITLAGTDASGTGSIGNGVTGASLFLAFSADATNGSFVESVRFQPVATAASTTTTATTCRLFVSTKSSGATVGGSDTFLFQETAVPSVVADAPTAAIPFFEIPVNKILPAGYNLLVTSHQTLASNTAIHCTVWAGQY